MNNEIASKAVLDNIFSRKSVRIYTEEPVSAGQVDIMLRAAMAAPSAKNLQPWRFVVVTSAEQREILAQARYGKMIARAPLAIVVCGQTVSDDGEPNPNWTADCAAATENLLLAAEALGLGAVWTACYPYEDRMAPAVKALGLPSNVIPYCVVPIGHPAGVEKPKDKWKPQNVHYDKW
ncbi:MAG: nitroreductase family protein [Bacteroidales bacterium]|nr:nitroreductase family protein [Bacteroidales bacterium]